MRLGWEWVDRENKRKNSLPTSDLVLPTTLIVISSEAVSRFIDLAVIYHMQAIVNQSY
ncbi:hypothetical protein [Calothrix sp. NIES-2098]|uniref:hypothetical protein n=1 Tax=Calothrix sp. NIES-2098 TaxID=1954171 RepID=UPI000B5E4952|nr:hypothetical protein NIES2098_24520 [Calothrix sp. NIES-2098]